MAGENELEKQHFEDLKKRIRYNYQIADFYVDRWKAEGADIPEYFVDDEGKTIYCDTPKNIYEYLLHRKSGDRGYGETKRDKWLSKSKAIFNCCKYFDINCYLKLKVKEVVRVNLCKDKFCPNCQKQTANEREIRFTPRLDELRQDYEVFHLVVTVPNCRGDVLKSTVNKMYKKFPYMLEFFKGKRKVKGIDFLSYGYGGAVRALEITQNKQDKLYHPHFHCMILFKKGLELEKNIVNVYSLDRGRVKNKFSAFEVLLQKMWFLLMNDEKVTAKAIDELKIGYDVHMSNSAGRYHEVFKYVCKGFFDEDDMFIYNAETFWTLYETLNNRRIIQGYGLLYDFNDCDDILNLETDNRYELIKCTLREIEKSTFRVEELDDIISRFGLYRYFSKSSLKRFLRTKRAEIEAKHILLAEELPEDFFDEPKQITIDF